MKYMLFFEMDLLLDGYVHDQSSDGSIKPESISGLPANQYVLVRTFTNQTRADVIKELSASANDVFRLRYPPINDTPGIIRLPDIRDELATITNLALLEDLANNDPTLLDKILCNLPNVPVYGSQKYLSITSGILPNRIVELNSNQQQNDGPLWYDVAVSNATLQKALGTQGYFWRVDIPLTSDGKIRNDLQLENLLDGLSQGNDIKVTGTIPFSERYIVPDIVTKLDNHNGTQGIVDSSCLELYKASLIGFEFIRRIQEGVETWIAEGYLRKLIASSKVKIDPTPPILGDGFGSGFLGRVIEE
jgi:hypothetical protein